MRAELAAMKLGSRVVYAVGGVEYNALALGTASEGWNQGIRLSSIFLSLTYLSELGVQVRVIAAPLLGVAADDDHLAEVADEAAKRTFGYVTADVDGRAQMVADELAHVKATPRTTGWRPYIETEFESEVIKLQAQVATLTAQVSDLSALVTALQSQPEDPENEAKKFMTLLQSPTPAVRAAVEAATVAQLNAPLPGQGDPSFVWGVKPDDGLIYKEPKKDQESDAEALARAGLNALPRLPLDFVPTLPKPLVPSANQQGHAVEDGDLFKPADPTNLESVLAAQAAGAAQLDPGSASSSTQAVDASSSQDEHGTAVGTSTSASTEEIGQGTGQEEATSNVERS